MAATPLLLTAIVLLAGAACSQDTPLCQRQGCSCVQNTATCVFDRDQVVELRSGALPAGSSVTTVELSGANELRVLGGALSGVRALQRLSVRNVGKVTLKSRALAANGDPTLMLEVSDCGQAVLESECSAGMRGALMALVARCAHVVVQPGAFSRLLALTITHVPQLEMAGHALAVDVTAGHPTAVTLEGVLVPELVAHTFPSSAVEVRLLGSEVRAVRADAFSALVLSSLSVVNSSLHAVDAGAFSQRMLVERMLLSGSRVRRLASGALLAAITNLTVDGCKIDEVESYAVNNTVAEATLQDNDFGLVRRRGFVLRKWNRLRIIGNTFRQLEEEAVWAPFTPVAGAPVSELSFSGNRLGAVAAGGLDWLAEAADGVGLVTGGGNLLQRTPCRCDLLAPAAAWVADSLLCAAATPELARCLGLAPESYLPLHNFTAAVCGDGDVVLCHEPPVELANPGGDRQESGGGHGTLLLCLLLVAGVSGAALVGGGAWLRRKRPRLPACLAALLSRRLDSGAVAGGGGVDGSPGHEYAELQPPPADTMEAADELPAEDKWTQTLPEELTQELLQSLRDKLDDPDNYSEARDMIEHLYDLIKVEESGAEERETGEVIRRSARGAASTRSTGTRAPSPSLLAPVSVSGDYLEPRDRSPNHHLYAELPPTTGPPAAAVICEYAEPRDSRAQHVYCELPTTVSMAARPLPSTPAD